MHRVLLWAGVGGYMAVIFVLSSQSNPLPSLTSSLNDKFLHGVEYGGLGALVVAALRSSSVPLRSACALAILGVSLYGATDELHQWFVPGRDSDVLDWLADTFGAVAGVTVTFFVERGSRRS